MMSEQSKKLEGALDDILGAEEAVESVLAADEGEVPVDLAGMMDRVYAEGRRLGSIGDVALMVSQDGLRVFVNEKFPAGTARAEVETLLKDAGICHGIRSAGIHQALAKQRARQRDHGRVRRAQQSEKREIILAAGTPPVPTGTARAEYLFAIKAAEAVTELVHRLRDFDFAWVEKCAPSLPFVRAGQKLARVVGDPGQDGCDVFGQQIAAPVSDGISLQAGEGADLDDSGRHCVARRCGYAVLVEERVEVISPVWVARDLLRAFFVWLGTEHSPPDAEDVHSALETEAIAFGVESEMIEKLCAQLANGDEVERVHAVAHGREAQVGHAGQWQYAFDSAQSRYYVEIARIVRRSPSADYLREYGSGLGGKSAAPGEVLARKEPPQQGVPGCDVFGEEFMPDQLESPALDLGEHLRLSDDGDECIAEIYGYVGIGRQRIEIVAPIWIAPDGMQAYYLNLPPLGECVAPTSADIQRLLQEASVQCGIDTTAIAVLCERLQQNLPTDTAVLLASGRQPIAGRDGSFEFYLDVESNPVAFREDGTVDFKALNLAPLVDRGQALGQRLPAVAGQSGRDVKGRNIAVAGVSELDLELGEHAVRVRSEDGSERVVADFQGELVSIDRSERTPPSLYLAVSEKMVVPGDVDYSTGHIDFPGSVEVRGTVRSGFNVRAGGNITVEGHVENNVHLQCEGHIAIQHGISGDKTIVRAKGSIYVKYINGARVQAGVDVVVAEYVFHSHISAGHCVDVLATSGKKQSGAILAGQILASKRVRAKHLGSGSAPPALLMVGVDSEIVCRLAALHKRLDQCREVIAKMQRALKIERVEKAQIESLLFNLVLKVSGPRRQVLARTVRKVLALLKERNKLEALKKTLDKEQKLRAQSASVEVSGEVALRTTVRIGAHSLVVGAEAAQVQKVKFVLVEVEGQWQVQMMAA